MTIDELIARFVNVEVNISVQINLLPAPGTGPVGEVITDAQKQALNDSAAKLEADLALLMTKIPGSTAPPSAVTLTLNPDKNGQTTPLMIAKGNFYTEPGAVASDASAVTVGGDTVDTTQEPGAVFTVTYDAVGAAQVVRVVNIF